MGSLRTAWGDISAIAATHGKGLPHGRLLIKKKENTQNKNGVSGVKWKPKVLGWMVFCWGKPVKEHFIKVKGRGRLTKGRFPEAHTGERMFF